jgi:hypothetical protein
MLVDESIFSMQKIIQLTDKKKLFLRTGRCYSGSKICSHMSITTDAAGIIRRGEQKKIPLAAGHNCCHLSAG